MTPPSFLFGPILSPKRAAVSSHVVVVVVVDAQGFWKVPDLSFDWETGHGSPFAYFTNGAACTEVEVDCLTGDHHVLRTDIVMDLGNPLNPAIDVGQIEGAFVQGLGLFCLEEMVWGDSQHLWARPGGKSLLSCSM